jgi:hypothetical protein
MSLGSANSVAANESAGLQALAGARVKAGMLKQVLAWAVLPVTFGLAITHQSLWMDEGYTVWFAAHKTIGSFFTALVGAPGATGDPQLLFYLLYMWGWVKVFGQSEFALRAANIPFALIFLGAMGWAAQKFLKVSNLWVLFCLCPFFWFYLNDARPYVALMAFSAVSVVALLAYLTEPAEYEKRAPWWCLIGLLLTWGTHILGALLFPALITLVVLAVRSDSELRSRFVRDWSRPFLICAPAFAALAGYFGWASAHGVNMEHGASGFSNFAFALYEFTGFSGLGVPRLELRQTPHASLFGSYWPWLALGAVPMLFLCYLTFRKRPSRMVAHLIVSLAVAVALAEVLAKVENFQILGRHMAVYFPLLWLMLMLWAKPLFESKRDRTIAIATIMAVGAVWIVSDLRLISLPKYERDDFRGAVRIAESRSRQDNARILWAADAHAAAYYGVRAVRPGSAANSKFDQVSWPVASEAVDAQNWTVEQASGFLANATTPVVLVVSRPDLYDNKGAWQALIAQRPPSEITQLTAFSIYEWQPRPNPAHAAGD